MSINYCYSKKIDRIRSDHKLVWMSKKKKGAFWTFFIKISVINLDVKRNKNIKWSFYFSHPIDQQRYKSTMSDNHLFFWTSFQDSWYWLRDDASSKSCPCKYALWLDLLIASKKKLLAISYIPTSLVEAYSILFDLN